MLQKIKKRKSFKTKLTGYILLLTIFGFVIFLINSLFLAGKPLFISPMGENTIGTKNGTKKIEKILRDNNISFSQVLALSDFSYRVTMLNGGQVRLSSKKDINRQITSLQRMLREFTIEGKSFKSIDFRFEEPIVSF